MQPTSLAHHFLYKIIIKWWAREVIFLFPRSSFHFCRIWWVREVNFICNDERGKFILKKPGGIPFFLYPASLARSGKVNLIYIKSAWKIQAFGTGFIKGTQGNHIETWKAKSHFSVVKSRLFAPPSPNYLGLGPFLGPFRPEMGTSIWIQLVVMLKSRLLSKKTQKKSKSQKYFL